MESSTAPQRKLVTYLWETQVRWAAEEECVEGGVALESLLRAVPAGLRSQPAAACTAESVRGDVCPCLAEEVSLPPAGSVPVPIASISPEAAEFFESWEKSMLLPDEEVDWDAYERLKPH